MLASVFSAFLREYRAHRMTRFAVYVAAYGVALWVVERTAGGVPRLLWLLFWAALAAVTFSFLGRLVGFVRHRLLWWLRWRLAVIYVFIAVVPILLILLLVLFKDFMTGGQFVAFLVAQKLKGRADELQQLTRVVGHEQQHSTRIPPDALLDRIQDFFSTELAKHAAVYPGLEITLRLGPRVRAFRLDGTKLANPTSVPAWLTREEFAGIVVDGDEFALRAINRGDTPEGELTVILSQPFTPGLLDMVGEGTGPVSVFVPQQSSPGTRSPAPATAGRPAELRGESLEGTTLSSKSVPIPPSASVMDSVVYGASTLEPVVWGGEKEEHLEQAVIVLVSSRMSTGARQLLATLGRYSQVYMTVFLSIAVVFLLVELGALVVGIRLTRSMTRTVDRLHAATEKIQAGDFSFRISQPAHDQLSALGEAFDGMTASVERLLRESQEKSRLEGELEIAREVQRRLFPRAAPEVPGLALYGVCKPARTVSGDYYDFLRLDETRVGLVLGDVSGKGISAALLMASIQSALRAQYHFADGCAAGPGAFPVRTADVVERLNRQLFESTSLEKYATFFYAVYDSRMRRLTYTNAGHLPPVVFRRDAIERLEAGGTVLGLFPGASYEQAEVVLQPGDVIVAFTDGLTEPENTFGEEFGEGRLVGVARRAMALPPDLLAEEIYRRVGDWTGSPELQDDMTLVVAKATA